VPNELILREPRNEKTHKAPKVLLEKREPLRRRGIEFHEVYGNRFGIRRGKTVVIFAPDKVQGGYYAGRSPQRVEDGSCLQIGIGGMPNAVCRLLMESSVKDLGIHTEMMTDNLCLLYRSGRITGSQKHSPL